MSSVDRIRSRHPAVRRATVPALAVAVVLGLGLPAHAAPETPRAAAGGIERPTEAMNLLADNPEAAAKAAELAPFNQRREAATEQRAYFVELATPSAARVFDRERARGASPAGARSRARDQRAAVETAATRVFRAARGEDRRASRLYDTTNVLAGTAVRMNGEAAAALSERDDVVAVRAIVPKTPGNASTTDFTGSLSQWQSTGQLGTGVSIGIIDTGIDYTHASFGGAGTVEAFEAAEASDTFDGTDKVLGGYDFVGDAYTGPGTLPVPDENPLDCQGHGSHVADSAAGLGVAADGSTFDGDYADLTTEDLQAMRIGPGSAPDADLYALRVFGCDGSTEYVMQALDWSLDPNGDGNFEDRLDIINLSLGSTYSSEDDPENYFMDEMTALGVLSVVASGNDGDLTLVGGSPGNATSALTVANSISNRLPYDGITVDAPEEFAGTHPGQYSISYTDRTPISGEVVRLGGDNAEGCTAYDAEEQALVDGKVVWLHWPEDFACGSVARVNNAAAAGAIGIVMDSEVDVFSAGLAGTDAIPMFQFTNTISEALEPALDAGELEVTFDFQVGTVGVDLPQIGDTLNPSSSRGAYGALNTVKPDVAAPGTQIMASDVGTGDQGALKTGTSMATPHVAGIAATLVETNPTWTKEEIKAAVMNTATHDVSATEDGAGPFYGPNRVGSGRVDAQYAVDNSVVAHSTNKFGEVAASFGVVEVPIDGDTVTDTRTVRVANKGDAPVTAAISYDEATNQPGVSYAVSPASLEIPAGGSAEVTITMTAVPGELDRELDPTMEATQLGVARQFTTLASGRLLVDTGDGDALRVPVSAAAKPVSTTSSSFANTGADSGTITLSGGGIDQGDYTSIVNVFDFGAGSPQKPECTEVITTGCTQGPADASGDLRYVGATSDYHVFPDDSFAWAAWGINTWSNWTAPGLASVPYVNIWTVADPATQAPDYELFAAPYYLFGLDVDLYASVLVHIPTNSVVWDMPLNMLEADVDTNVFDSDTMVLSTPLDKLYAEVGEAPESLDDLSYQVGSYSLYGYGADEPIDQVPSGRQTIPFDPRNAAVVADEGLLLPDQDGVAIDVTRAAGSDAGQVLVLHQHGASGERAEVVEWLGADTTAPTLVATTGSPAVVGATNGTGDVRFAWEFTDPEVDGETTTGVADYDVRERLDDGEWTEPEDWQGIAETEVTRAVPVGSTVCFEVRARDNAGNVSEWGGERCTRIDAEMPVITTTTVTPSPVADSPRGQATFSYAATDDDGVASYDVGFRIAPAGKPFGAWQAPAAWQATTATQVSRGFRRGDNLCFRVRARDNAGNVSSWSEPECTAAPFDDRQLNRGGDTVLRTQGRAMNRTITVLRSRGARLVKPKQRARTITVYGLCGPRDGAIEVFMGKRKVGASNLRCSKANAGPVRLTFRADSLMRGRLRVVSRSDRPVRIDGVALSRQAH